MDVDIKRICIPYLWLHNTGENSKIMCVGWTDPSPFTEIKHQFLKST